MSRKAYYKLACTAGLAIFLAGCAVGPKYTRPTVPTAPAYKEGLPATFKESNGWKQAQPDDQALRTKWWEMFGDAQLNALEERVNVDNQSLKVAESRFRQARAAIRFNRANQYPTLTTSPSISRAATSNNRALRSVAGSYGDFVLPFDLSYEVDVWGRIRRAVEAAREEFQATAADLETVRLSLHSELAIDYFELRSLDAQKRILDEAVANFERAYQLTRNRYEGGAAAAAEVAQAETQLESTRAQNIDVGVERAQFEHAIAVLIGQNPESLSIAPEPLKSVPPSIPVGLPSQLLERRPDIASAERRVAVANEQVGIARIAFFPAVILGASAGLEGTSITNWFNWPSRFWAIGPTALQTIFDGGRRRAVSESAEANYDATIASYRDTALGAFREVEDNLAALRILEEESKTQRSAVVAAQRSLELSNSRYKGGIVTYLEVITAQSAALVNERTEVDLLRRRMDASVLLIKALGGGWNESQLPRS
jgi:NodT family efflux transporter outer membrane factor (OMF) lipoprotein